MKRGKSPGQLLRSPKTGFVSRVQLKSFHTCVCFLGFVSKVNSTCADLVVEEGAAA